MSYFVSDYVAKHVRIADIEKVGTKREVLVVHVGIDAAAGVVHKGLAEDFLRDLQAAGQDPNRKVGRPGYGRTTRARGLEISPIRRGTDEPIHLNTGLSKHGGRSSLSLGKGIGVYPRVVEEGDLNVRNCVWSPGENCERRRKRGCPNDEEEKAAASKQMHGESP